MAWDKEFFMEKGRKGGLKTKSTRPTDYYKEIRKMRKTYKKPNEKSN